MCGMVCYTCQKDKEISEFSIKRGTRRNTECKTCKNAYNKTWYQRNKKKHIKAVGRNNSKKLKNTKIWIDKLKNHPCMDCGNSFPSCAMDFDHRPGETKKNTVSVLRARTVSKKILLTEIAKCDLVCANCHRIRTFQRRLLST